MHSVINGYRVLKRIIVYQTSFNILRKGVATLLKYENGLHDNYYWVNKKTCTLITIIYSCDTCTLSCSCVQSYEYKIATNPPIMSMFHTFEMCYHGYI